MGNHPILAIIYATSEVAYILVETMGMDDIAQEKCVVWKGRASFLKVECNIVSSLGCAMVQAAGFGKFISLFLFVQCEQ